MIFVDTSALIALMDSSSSQHPDARATFATVGRSGELTTHNYVATECIAVVQRRGGLGPVRQLVERILPVISIIWVDEAAHDAATGRLFTTDRRELSFVDCVSFEVMRSRRITTAFAFDEDFTRHGFTTVP